MFKNLSTEPLGISGTSSEVIEVALSYGFASVDLDIVDFSAQVKTQGLPKARRLFDSAKLRFGSFRLPLEWHDDPSKYTDGLKALPQYLELAKQLGCTRAITTIEPAGDMRPFHENFEYHRRKIDEIAAKLNEFGISLGLEFFAPHSHRHNQAFQFIQSTDQLLQLFKGISAPNAGLVLDTWHWYLGGGTIDKIQGMPANRIVAVYLADCDPGVTAATATENARKLPGETGVIDCVAILSALGEAKYDGPVSPLPFRGNLPGMGREKIVKTVAAALDQAWKAAGLNPQGKLLPAKK
jgi:sugar phosphate isomerase/epimerase